MIAIMWQLVTDDSHEAKEEARNYAELADESSVYGHSVERGKVILSLKYVEIDFV